MLKPVDNAQRQTVSLNGLWRFCLDSPNLDSPWKRSLPGKLECPLPSSYNDIFVVESIRDYVGKVWYQREVRVPDGLWKRDNRLFVRIGAATHEGEVYIGDKLVTRHVGGYTPFEADLPDTTGPGDIIRITIGVDNRLTNESIPPGRLSTDELGEPVQTYWHDFFNYSGLTRNVILCSVPRTRIEDVTVVTEINGTTGVIDVKVETVGVGDKTVKLELRDEDGKAVASGSDISPLQVSNGILWQPGAAYLYDLKISLYTGDNLVDEYNLPVGIRTVRVEKHQFLINDRPFYFKGFGWHEDRPVKGKGHDSAWMMHDLELMKWLGANSFRTAHYPYDEEVYEYADRHGWVVIDETPADFANDNTRSAHAQAITELVARDKNHPSVVMWCLTNEPDAALQGARGYFQPLTELARKLDPTRPLIYTNTVRSQPETDLIADLFDVIGINRYYGWYSETGNLRFAAHKLEKELKGWYTNFGKPVIMCEYGADAVAGLHSMENIPWSEEFQAQFLEVYHEVFDKLEFVQGEHPWAFADFSTGPVVFRADGNKKGIFTRDRRPKMAAQVLRRRWNGTF